MTKRTLAEELAWFVSQAEGPGVTPEQAFYISDRVFGDTPLLIEKTSVEYIVEAMEEFTVWLDRSALGLPVKPWRFDHLLCMYRPDIS